MSGGHLSKEFFDLVKAIGESKSKQEEDRIITHEVHRLKSRFLERNLSKRSIKENLIRMIYVEMLGHDASFAYVHAIQMTAAGDLIQKKVGYLCASLTLSPEHEFRFMLVNQLQRDLASVNVLEVCIGLIALCKLITNEMIPAMLPSVVKLLTHEQSIVRKKVVMALHRIYQLDPSSIEHLRDKIRRMLCDKDPAVMGATLCIMHELAKANPREHKDLIPSYVSVLRQIIDHKLSRDFDYHRIPAPWLQIKLLKMFATLGQNDQAASNDMYDILHECMKRANAGIYVGYAIIYECVRTITTIYPSSSLLDVAADAIARFISSDSHNLKYLGVTGLASIVRDHPKYAAEHQMVVLDCLEDPDETLKRKTLDLLYRMTNPVNAEVVVQKLIHYLSTATDKYLRQELVSNICQLAERFAPDNIWYVQTITKACELGGDLVEAEVAHNLLRLLADGAEDDDAGDDEDDATTILRREACEIFYELFEKPHLPEILLRVAFWTLGEYAYLLGTEVLPEVLEVIVEVSSRESCTPATRRYGLSATMKITAQLGQLPDEASILIDKCATSMDVDVQYRAFEFRELSHNMTLMQSVLPVDASCEDLTEPDFHAIDEYVQRALADGADDYRPPTKDESMESEYMYDDTKATAAIHAPALKYDAYEKPTLPTVKPAVHRPVPEMTAPSSASTGFAATGTTQQQNGLNLQGVKTMWGSSGYNGSKPTATPPKPESAVPKVVEAVAAKPSPPPYMQSTTPDQSRNPTPPPPPAKSPALTERERMAAALFGGVAGGSANSSPSTSSPARTRANRKAVGQPAARPKPAEVENLLDFDGGGGDDEHHNPPVVAQSASIHDDLLNMDMPAPSNPPPQKPASVPAAADDWLGGFMSTPAAPPAASVRNTPFIEAEMSTQQFGQKWTLNSSEKKFALSLNVSMNDLVNLLCSKLGVKVVEIIPTSREAILAGMESGSQTLVLIHAKIRNFVPAGTDFTVRSSNQKTLGVLISEFQKLQ